MSAGESDEDDDDDEEEAAPDFSAASLAVLSQRLDSLRDSASAERVQEIMDAAANWKSGRCAQRVVCILDDWIRRLDVLDGTLACGTYTGDVALVDIATGSLVDSWDTTVWDTAESDTEYDGQSEITAIRLCLSSAAGGGEASAAAAAEQQQQLHVLSGDAAGTVYMRVKGQATPLLRATHRAPVSGVHYDGVSRLYSASLDSRLACYDLSDLPSSSRGDAASQDQLPSSTLSLREPILQMSTFENYAALALSDGSVSLVTLSPLRTLFTFRAHTKAATTAVCLMTSSQLVTGAADGTVCLWRLDEDGDSDRRCTTFEGHQGPVVCLYADGEKVVSGSRDGSVRVWEAETGQSRFVLHGYTNYIGSLHVSPTSLLSDGTNNAVIQLDFTEEAVREQQEQQQEEDEEDEGDGGLGGE